MTGSAADLAILMKAFGVGVPVGFAIMAFLIITIVVKFIGAKQDKDRNEHLEKWNSMIAMQKAAIDNQAETMRLIMDGTRAEFNTIITTHQDEFNRLYKQYENRSAQLDIICHNISTMSKVLESKSFCPNQKGIAG